MQAAPAGYQALLIPASGSQFAPMPAVWSQNGQQLALADDQAELATQYTAKPAKHKRLKRGRAVKPSISDDLQQAADKLALQQQAEAARVAQLPRLVRQEQFRVLCKLLAAQTCAAVQRKRAPAAVKEPQLAISAPSAAPAQQQVPEAATTDCSHTC